MAANWDLFISQLSDFLSSKTSSGPKETGEKLAQIYIKAISTSQTPFGNTFSYAPGKEALEIAFSKVFESLSTSQTPTAEEKKADPKFKPAKTEPVPDEKSIKRKFEEDFKIYLREKRLVKFKFYELDIPQSEYVYESDQNRFNELLIKRKISDGTNDSLRSEYDNERIIYENLKNDYVKQLSDQNTKSSEQENAKKEKDPYDDLSVALIAFWATSGPAVFSPSPAILPATTPIPGTYSITYTGSPDTLADGIRRAFNMGLDEKYQNDESGKNSATEISKSLAVVFAKHLATLKFTYSGAIGETPSISLVPFIY